MKKKISSLIFPISIVERGILRIKPYNIKIEPLFAITASNCIISPLSEGYSLSTAHFIRTLLLLLLLLLSQLIFISVQIYSIDKYLGGEMVLRRPIAGVVYDMQDNCFVQMHVHPSPLFDRRAACSIEESSSAQLYGHALRCLLGQ